MIAVIDYGAGNLDSVRKALAFIGVDARLTTDPDCVFSSAGAILPGVGAFGRAAAELDRLGLSAAVHARAQAEAPLLGICLGMQLLFDGSDERFPSDSHSPHGLGLIQGSVRRLKPGLKVPHVGWNQVSPAGDCPLFRSTAPGTYLYFVHSYYVDPTDPDLTAATTDYGVTFASAVWSGQVYGVQFHPEKSGADGLDILSAFAHICGEVD